MAKSKAGSALSGGCLGALVGVALGAVIGGVAASIYGVPFSGTKGPAAFLQGMFFPGLIIVAPVCAAICAMLGSLVGGPGSKPPRD